MESGWRPATASPRTGMSAAPTSVKILVVGPKKSGKTTISNFLGQQSKQLKPSPEYEPTAGCRSVSSASPARSLRQPRSRRTQLHLAQAASRGGCVRRVQGPALTRAGRHPTVRAPRRRILEFDHESGIPVELWDCSGDQQCANLDAMAAPRPVWLPAHPRTVALPPGTVPAGRRSRRTPTPSFLYSTPASPPMSTTCRSGAR